MQACMGRLKALTAPRCTAFEGHRVVLDGVAGAPPVAYAAWEARDHEKRMALAPGAVGGARSGGGQPAACCASVLRRSALGARPVVPRRASLNQGCFQCLFRAGSP